MQWVELPPHSCLFPGSTLIYSDHNIEQMNEKSLHVNIVASHKKIEQNKQKNHWAIFFNISLHLGKWLPSRLSAGCESQQEVEKIFSFSFGSASNQLLCPSLRILPSVLLSPKSFYLILYTIMGAVKRSNKWLVFKALWGQWQWPHDN